MNRAALKHLYQNLNHAVYTVKSDQDAEFLTQLVEPLPFVMKRANPEHWPHDGDTLAVFPSKKVNDLKASILWHEEAIQEEQSYYVDHVYGEACEEFLSASTAQYIRSLRADLATLETELATF